MSGSCGELGLRIALCDVIERLKRCEQKCSYLEECRHELIKEVMRLKTHNHTLLATANASNPTHHMIADSANHLPNNQINCFHNNNNNNNNCNNHVMIGSVNGLDVDNKTAKKNSEYELFGSDCDNRDESWQQITVRLLQGMRRDVAANGLNGVTSGVVAAYDGHELNADLMDNIISDDIQINTNNDTIISINDSMTQMNDNLIESKAYSTSSRQKQALTVNEVTNEDILSPFNEFNIKSPFLIGLTDNKIRNKLLSNTNNTNSDNNRRESGAQVAENRDLELSGKYSTLHEGLDQLVTNSESVTAFREAMSSVKEDLNEVLMALTTQNEKLNRLKAKQLRNFFNRQINLDQNIHQSSAASSKRPQN